LSKHTPHYDRYKANGNLKLLKAGTIIVTLWGKGTTIGDDFVNNQQLTLLLLLFMVSAPTLAESVVEVISVYNRPASEIQPLLMPLLENTDQIVANGDSLIVKTTPERVQTITNIIRKLDNPLNNLLITIIQSRDVTAAQLNAGIGFDIQVPLQQPGNVRGNVQGYYNQSQGQNNRQNTQTIRTLEGVPAHIKAGNIVPITNYQTYRDGYGYPYESRSTQLVEATTGFEVTPRLVGQQVMLDVSPWSDNINAQGQFQTQEANTSIRANLGEWVDLGGVNENTQSSGNTPFGYNNQSGQNNLHILVKVDRVN
jgi:type II secretory pathway component GspD/PulD (secretin)